jgi:hypothetical protein
MADMGRLRKDVATKEQELLEKSKQAADADLRLAMFRNYLTDNGIVVDLEEALSKRAGSPLKVHELETKLAERVRMHEEAMRELESVKLHKDDAESQAGLLSAQLDRLRSSQSPSNSNRDDSIDARANAAERRLAETEQSHKDRLQQMETDYQAAVNYARSGLRVFLLIRLFTFIAGALKRWSAG